MIKNARKPTGFWGGLMINAMNKGHSALSEWGLSLLPVVEYRDAIDIGCGGGVNVLRLSKICSGTVYGIDPSPLCLKKSTAKCSRLLKSGRARFIKGTADSLPFDDNVLSLVTAFETVYFWISLSENFSEVYRVLKPGGIFLITNELTADKTEPDRYKELEKTVSLNIYTEEELSAHLESAGFILIQSHRKGNYLTLTAIKPSY